MQKIVIEDGQVLICTPVKATISIPSSASKPFALNQYKSLLKRALTARIGDCIERLQLAVNDGNVYYVDKEIIGYTGGHFSFPAYNAMVSAIGKLAISDSVTVANFESLELNQMIKALPHLTEFHDPVLVSALMDELARKIVPQG